ncbi:MAG TPA: hypothetical protein VIK57_03475 [Streptosporangiaceae bacterium]
MSKAPAAQVAAVYHQHRGTGNCYGELKTRLRGASFILRSRSPELVRQELFAFLTVYQALCALKTEAAQTAGIDPDRIPWDERASKTPNSRGRPGWRWWR